jgi:two-component system, OmpR family, phosphate regulon sensor histidine kinase PhoR
MRLGIRSFLFFACLVVALVAAITAALAGPATVIAALPMLPADQARSVAAATRGLATSVALAAGVAALVVGVAGGTIVGRPLQRLRRWSAVAGELGPDGAPARSVIREVDGLAASLRRLVADAQGNAADLKRQRDEVERLLAVAGEGVLQVDAQHRVVRCNAAAERLLRLPPQAAGQRYDTVVRSASLRRALAQALESGAGSAGEHSTEDRTLFFRVEPLAKLRGAEAPADRGVESGAVALLVDLTDVRRLESVRRDFVANASHELKTPLTSIRGYAETLLGGDVPADTTRRFLETIRDNATRLQHIVDDLLDLTRLESGGWAPHPELLDIPTLAAESWRAVEERARARGVSLRLEPETGATGLADRMALTQIFSNLFDNSLRHTPAGGVIRVAVGAAAQSRRSGGGDRSQGAAPAAPDAVWVEVSDTGTGIPRDAIDRIFERFYRVDPARSRAEGGTGLGLAIVKHLVENMGGTVEAASELGKGTSIRFSLPSPADAAHVETRT